MAKYNPQQFGYRNWCEMYDTLKDKGVTNQTIYLQRMESNGEVKTHKIRMSTVERNAWREVAETMLTPDEIRELESVVYHSNMDYNKIIKVRKFLSLFRY